MFNNHLIVRIEKHLGFANVINQKGIGRKKKKSHEQFMLV